MSATREQILTNLELANEVRVQRAKLRLRVAAGEISAARLIEDGVEGCVARVETFAFLMWLPKVGHANAGRMLRRAGVPGHRRLDQLTDRQIEALISAVRDAEAHPRGGGS